MTPIVIPTPAGACFGMYSCAPGPAVLICPPFGDEALKTARIWRDLAVDLTAHGLATLRFDLPGTGNSAGDPAAPGRVAAWRSAVRACAAWLASRHDGHLTLLGHRFGALLALDAADLAERLVLLDPPDSGAAAVRYLRARARLAGLGPAPEPDSIQVGGVPLSTETLRDLQTLPAPLHHVAPRTLLFLHARSPWPEALRAAGSVVETAPFEGFEDFVPHDAFRAKPPAAVLAHIVSSLASDPPYPPERASAGAHTPEIQGQAYTETPIRFGPKGAPDGTMFGIICTPDRPRHAAPALLLPTTGIDPSCGLSGMWTELARRVARDGITTLRFDMRGVGESEGRLNQDKLVAAYHPDRMTDIGHAVDALAARGFDRTTIVAYCSGAYAAWHAAVPDRRIAGVLTGNLLYLSRQTHLAPDALRQKPGSSRIGLAALRRLDDRLRRALPRPVRHMLRGWAADPKATRRHVRALTARGCAISIVTAADDHGHVRLRQAYGDALRLPSGVELNVIADADHQFSDRRHRARFLELAAAFALRDAPPTAHPTARPTPTRILETA